MDIINTFLFSEESDALDAALLDRRYYAEYLSTFCLFRNRGCFDRKHQVALFGLWARLRCREMLNTPELPPLNSLYEKLLVGDLESESALDMFALYAGTYHTNRAAIEIASLKDGGIVSTSDHTKFRLSADMLSMLESNMYTILWPTRLERILARNTITTFALQDPGPCIRWMQQVSPTLDGALFEFEFRELYCAFFLPPAIYARESGKTFYQMYRDLHIALPQPGFRQNVMDCSKLLMPKCLIKAAESASNLVALACACMAFIKLLGNTKLMIGGHDSINVHMSCVASLDVCPVFGIYFSMDNVYIREDESTMVAVPKRHRDAETTGTAVAYGPDIVLAWMDVVRRRVPENATLAMAIESFRYQETGQSIDGLDVD